MSPIQRSLQIGLSAFTPVGHQSGFEPISEGHTLEQRDEIADLAIQNLARLEEVEKLVNQNREHAERKLDNIRNEMLIPKEEVTLFFLK